MKMYIRMYVFMFVLTDNPDLSNVQNCFQIIETEDKIPDIMLAYYNKSS